MANFLTDMQMFTIAPLLPEHVILNEANFESEESFFIRSGYFVNVKTQVKSRSLFKYGKH